jgi:hypothetical protein
MMIWATFQPGDQLLPGSTDIVNSPAAGYGILTAREIFDDDLAP